MQLLLRPIMLGDDVSKSISRSAAVSCSLAPHGPMAPTRPATTDVVAVLGFMQAVSTRANLVHEVGQSLREVAKKIVLRIEVSVRSQTAVRMQAKRVR